MGIYILSMVFLLAIGACQNNNTDVDPSLYTTNVDSAWNENLSQKITVEELPVTIKEEIYNDELFQDLDISDITKITKDDSTYYDMTFRDTDGHIIMVFYDQKGEIIVP
jgi:hypothetical protein